MRQLGGNCRAQRFADQRQAAANHDDCGVEKVSDVRQRKGEVPHAFREDLLCERITGGKCCAEVSRFAARWSTADEFSEKGSGALRDLIADAAIDAPAGRAIL